MSDLPLQGIRVLDLGQVYAGPLASRVLADLGAEVIRIESDVRSTRGGRLPQPGAVYPGGEPGMHPYNRSAYYNELHRNKLAVSLNLSKEKGKDVFMQLAGISDVVIENFTPRVMQNFGLEYSVLSKINPQIIMISISAYGQTGPYRDYVSFGRGIEAMSGLADITGYPESGPIGPGTAYADATGGLHGAFAILLALRQRRRTGNGQYIDLSLQESLISLLGEYVVDYTMNQRKAIRNGNNDGIALFQECFRCLGDDSWIAIALHSEKEIEALEGLISRPVDPDDPATLRQSIGEWTMQHEPNAAMIMLQQSGIAAGVVQCPQDLIENEHLHQRGFFQVIEHPEAGAHTYPGTPWRMGNIQYQAHRPAPCFAEHNEYVFGTLLGMSKDTIAELEAEGIAARVPLQ